MSPNIQILAMILHFRFPWLKSTYFCDFHILFYNIKYASKKNICECLKVLWVLKAAVANQLNETTEHDSLAVFTHRHDVVCLYPNEWRYHSRLKNQVLLGLVICEDYPARQNVLVS